MAITNEATPRHLRHSPTDRGVGDNGQCLDWEAITLIKIGYFRRISAERFSFMVEIVWETHGVVRKLSGRITAAEMDASAKEIQSSARLDDLRYNIHDFSAVTEALLPDEEIEFMGARARFALSRNSKIKMAFVGNQEIVYRLMNAFNCCTGDSKTRVFRFDTIEDARKYVSG